MSQIAEQKIALNQFSEKLAALRQTMSKKEQSLLDAVVANSAFEVSAHGIAVNSAVINSAVINWAVINQAVDFAAVAKEADDIEDVQAHAAIATAAYPTETVVIQFNVATGYEVIPFGTTGAVSTGRVIR